MKTTDIITFCSDLQASMKAKLLAITQENQNFLQRVAKCRCEVKTKIDDIRDFVYQYKFLDNGEQIRFFKEIKPVFFSQYYYYDKLFALKVLEPVGDNAALDSYYRSFLNDLQVFSMTHKEFVGYCLCGATNLDDLYFVMRPSVSLDPQLDTRFSTGYDTTLAIFLANELVKDDVVELLKKLDRPRSISHLTWTAKKAYLVELVYALHEAEVFNDGRAEIKEIAALFENQFNTSLGNYYRHFAEITVRKTNRTNFLDLLKSKLTKRLDEADY